MAACYDIKSGKREAYIDIQVALYWELQRAGTDEGLDFDAAKHVFTVKGEVMPSVTFILKHQGIMPDMQFVTDHGLLRGTYVHKTTEWYDKGTLDEDVLDDELKPYLDSYKAFKVDWTGKILHAEKKLWHPVYKYAGIIDRIVEGNQCYILLLTPGKSRPYDLKPVENIRGALNVGLSALNVLKWKQQNQREE